VYLALLVNMRRRECARCALREASMEPREPHLVTSALLDPILLLEPVLVYSVLLAVPSP
jgi:hypothetical protein